MWMCASVCEWTNVVAGSVTKALAMLKWVFKFETNFNFSFEDVFIAWLARWCWGSLVAWLAPYLAGCLAASLVRFAWRQVKQVQEKQILLFLFFAISHYSHMWRKIQTLKIIGKASEMLLCKAAGDDVLGAGWAERERERGRGRQSQQLNHTHKANSVAH